MEKTGNFLATVFHKEKFTQEFFPSRDKAVAYLEQLNLEEEKFFWGSFVPRRESPDQAATRAYVVEVDDPDAPRVFHHPRQGTRIPYFIATIFSGHHSHRFIFESWLKAYQHLKMLELREGKRQKYFYNEKAWGYIIEERKMPECEKCRKPLSTNQLHRSLSRSYLERMLCPFHLAEEYEAK